MVWCRGVEGREGGRYVSRYSMKLWVTLHSLWDL